MTLVKTKINRRSFLKVSALAGGGLILSFSWLTGCKPSPEQEALGLPDEWFELNSYIKIGENGRVTLYSPNPEFGSNVKTSMPMILADELDVDWKNVIVEQADFHPDRYERQFTGGSQGIRQGWNPLRTAGASARLLLVNAAAQNWEVAVDEITTSDGVLFHKASGKESHYGEVAALASTLAVPEEVKLKDLKDLNIVGTSKKNVDLHNILTGKPLFGLDKKQEGMLVAVITHPPAFGIRMKSVDTESVKSMPGIMDVFSFEVHKEDYDQNYFDTTTHQNLVAIVGNTTWEVLQAKRALKIEWEESPERSFNVGGFGRDITTVKVPAGLENTESHLSKMDEHSKKPASVLRKDGNPEEAFKRASKVLERTYTAPFLAHNCMEPVNCYAHVTADQAEIFGPTQAPDFISNAIAHRLGLPKEKIKINLARMGGGFGQRAYGHHMVEAAVISQKVGAPVKMMYTREDDMTYGIYRPTYTATYRAAIDQNGELSAIHIKAGGIPETPIAPNRFPAGAVDNYLAEGWDIPSNITIGAFRAPRSNFIASAEQSFIDELAEELGKDPIDFRLELLARAKNKPVGSNNDYDPDRYAGVLKLVREKADWDNPPQGVYRGVSAYFCHNSYVAEILDLRLEGNKPIVERVVAAVDCGIVINPDAAANMGEGAIVDGIGNAFYGEMPFKDGVPQKNNFNTYRMIRASEAPRKIDVHFVKNDIDPTGLGEPLFPPVFAAVSNALYKATGRRFYAQPFGKELENEMLRM